MKNIIMDINWTHTIELFFCSIFIVINNFIEIIQRIAI